MLNVVNFSKMAVLGSLLLTSTCVHAMDDLENDAARFQDRSSTLSFQEKQENMERDYGYRSPYQFCYAPRMYDILVYDQGFSSHLDYSMFQSLDETVHMNMANVIAEYKEIQSNFDLRHVENNPRSSTNQPVVESEFVRELKAKRQELRTSRSQEKVPASLSAFDIRW